jgi:hypothetical protein
MIKRATKPTKEPKSPQTNQETQKKALGKTRKELKHRARIIAKEMLNGSSQTAACVKAGYSTTTSLCKSTAIVNNSLVKKTFNEILEKSGLTDEAISEKINSLVHAKETKFFSDKGVITDQVDVDALSIQADMVKFAAKIKGHVVERSININIDCNPVDLSRWANSVKVEGNVQDEEFTSQETDHNTSNVDNPPVSG